MTEHSVGARVAPAAGVTRLTAFARRYHDRLTALKGWRRWLAVFLLGVLSAAALPPVYLVFLLIPAFAGLFWVVLAAPRPWRALLDGWLWGAGHSVGGFYWISNSLLVDAASHAWLIPLSVLGFAALLGGYAGSAAFFVRLFAGRPAVDTASDTSLGTGKQRSDIHRALGAALLLAAAWTFFEWVRSWLFTGFPWNLIGTVWTFSDAAMQGSALIGAYGMTLVTVFAAVAPAVFAYTGEEGEPVAQESRVPVLAVAAGAVLLAGLYGYGAVRLAGAPALTDQEMVDGVVLRLVQPNIRQADKWRPDLRTKHVLTQLRMSAAAAPQDNNASGDPEAPSPTHFIWAETAVPFFLNEQPDLVRALAQVTPVKGALITGAIRISDRGTPDQAVWNSLYAVEASGRIAETYDKFHLVPFGEFVPFQEYLDFLRIASSRGNYSAGPGLRVLNIRGLPPVTPLICYEVIFPGEVVPPASGSSPSGSSSSGSGAAARPEWLLNITNDAWFGISAGPHQHHASARVRAVEEGLPLVRVANTGISAVVDAYGRELVRIGLGVAGFADSRLPRPLAGETLFARLGPPLPLGLALFIAVAGLLVMGRDQPTRKNKLH